MKAINEYLQGGSTFKNKVKYSKADWEKWKKAAGEDVFVGNYEDDKDLELAYIQNSDGKKMQHIGTYNNKKEILWCDDIEFFGHEV